ncbi:hypothetical protein [Oceanobacillus manasiensis]|uniref:hypothetical protein n=1 Tax=Oceanobacillus manasiensis TaxID=586413 RepID=UPI0005A896E1|nr:hypothetical protein [Oceanobacillus manasiensis]
MKGKMWVTTVLILLSMVLVACGDLEEAESVENSRESNVDHKEEVKNVEKVENANETENKEEEDTEEVKNDINRGSEMSDEVEDSAEENIDEKEEIGTVESGYGKEAYEVLLANEQSALNGDIDAYLETLTSDNVTEKNRDIYTQAFEETDYISYETHSTKVLEAAEDKVVIEVEQTSTYEVLEERATYEAARHFKHTLVREDGEYKIQSSEMIDETA